MADPFGGVVIFDGDCPVCSRTAGVIRKLDDVGIVAWDDPAAQAFLEAQFASVPFSLVFVDGEAERVYVGEDAAVELADRAGMPGVVGDFLGEHYHAMASTIQRTVGRGTVPDEVRGEAPLRDEATFETLAEAATTVAALGDDSSASADDVA